MEQFMNKAQQLVVPLAMLTIPAFAQTLPTGGSIVQGAGSVAVNGAQMVVKQDSARMVADWHSFSIGAANAVRFVQPSANAVALNRVTGGDPSAILGQGRDGREDGVLVPRNHGMTHPLRASRAPSRGRHQRTGKAGSAAFA